MSRRLLRAMSSRNTRGKSMNITCSALSAKSCIMVNFGTSTPGVNDQLPRGVRAMVTDIRAGQATIAK
jgi:hypothetical protein